MNIYGFSFLKDGVRFDYPFKESLSSLNQFTKKTYLALGENNDGTSEIIATLPFVEVIPTVWDMSLMGRGGIIFSQQTNIALQRARDNHRHEQCAWGLYFQGDELIHEREKAQLFSDIKKADASGCDAIRFRYFHFWKKHSEIAISKRWYPQEIRACKLDSDVINHGDAQMFSGYTKVFDSDVTILHYGHVRDEKKRDEKQDELIKFIRPLKKFKKYKSREERSHAQTKTIPYYGPHPLCMKERIERLGGTFHFPPQNEIFIVGPKIISEDLLNLLNVTKIHWHESIKQVPIHQRKQAIIINPTWWEKYRYHCKTPTKMESDLATPWPVDIRFILQASAKGFSFKNS